MKRSWIRRSQSPLKRTPLRRKRKNGTKITKDGRVIYYGTAYTKKRVDTWEEQDGRCHECGRVMAFDQMDLHHTEGRGLGGGKRDDRKVVGICNIPREESNWLTGKKIWLPRGCHSHIDYGKTESRQEPIIEVDGN